MYAKIFEQIFDSTLADNHEIRHVFMDLLVLADKTGAVDMTIPAIARRTNVPIGLVKRAIEVLTAPDEASRSKNDDGRRILLMDPGRDWGWQIVNFQAYHRLRDENGRREYMRAYMRDRRAKGKGCKHPVNTPLTPVNSCKPPLAHEDEDEDEYEDIDIDKTKETNSSVSNSDSACAPLDVSSEEATEGPTDNVQPAFLAQQLQMILGRHGQAKQFKADRTTLTKIGVDLNAGVLDHLADDRRGALLRIFEIAQGAADNPEVKKKTAWMVAWHKAERKKGLG